MFKGHDSWSPYDNYDSSTNNWVQTGNKHVHLVNHIMFLVNQVGIIKKSKPYKKNSYVVLKKILKKKMKMRVQKH